MIIIDAIFAGILLSISREFFEREMNFAGWAALFCSAFETAMILSKLF